MKVSIGIPVYNAAEFLEDAIESIIAQTFTDWELIIIDDGSTDNSLAIAKKYESDKVRVYSDGLNKKLPARLNEIIRLSKYDIIARMDADDLILPDKFEKQYNVLIQNPDIDLVSTGIIAIDSNNNVIGTRSTPNSYCPSLLDVVAGRAGIIHASIMVRKEWFERNPYNEAIIQAEDFQLWIDAKLKNDLKVYFIEEPLYCYREDQNVSLAKMLRGYYQQRQCIADLYERGLLPFFYSVKERFKLFIKSLLVRMFFLFNKQNILLKKRSQESSENSYYQSVVDIITK
ncbi:glycosyltransferase family 2 protein [Nitrincola tapanii]|uniref:Glycosyltransferase n=1 Tax=Nitrincola tapanii TaxID=1708751 RepID=A0A5A9W8D5_9GAMM|nr:glycosyltransferase [Nitrincola tapanii]KAA0875741.1 glycosyltransferase [Nitrincola tapanii]